MGTPYRNYASKLSIPGKSNDELTYAFHESSLEYHHAPLTLFGVFSIKSTSEQYQILIAETVKNFLEYYRKLQNSDPGMLKQDGVNSREFIFENAIQHTHERVTRALLESQDERGKTQGIDMKKVHFMIGALCEGQLYASVTGSGIHALYIYPVYQKHGFSHYANVDVIHGSRESGESNSSSRLFSSIISGNISIPRSILAVCNSFFLDYISVEQLKQVVTGNPSEAVAPYFQRLMGKINAKNDFCALFLDAHYIPSAAAAHAMQQTASNESMAALNSKEEGTEKILFPAFAAQIKKTIPLLWKGILFCIRTGLPHLIKIAKKFFTQSMHGLQNMRIIQKKKWRNTEKFEKKEKKQADNPLHVLYGNVASFLHTHLHFVHTRLLLLPHTSKSLLFISVLFLTLFGASILIIQKKNTEQKQQRAIESMLQIAEEKNDLAEASLLYDNTEKARALLIETQQAVRDFPLTDTKHAKRYANINERMQTIANRINHITPLKNLTTLTDLATSIQSPEQLALASAHARILLYSSSGTWSVDLSNGTITPIETQTKIPFISCGIELTETSFYICDAEARRIYVLDTNSHSIRPIPLTLAKEETGLDAVALYNQRLYVLTAANGTLFRHRKNKDGFEIGLPIIKNVAFDAEQKASLAIDGNIYILERGEQIMKYASGKQGMFILPLLDPRISKIQKIWTDADTSTLYLLEPAQKRIIVVDKKTRALKAQLVSDTLGTARDFAIIPEKKILLVLSGTTLYQSPLDVK